MVILAGSFQTLFPKTVRAAIDKSWRILMFRYVLAFVAASFLFSVGGGCAKPTPPAPAVVAPPPPPPPAAEPPPAVREVAKNFSRVQFRYDSARLTSESKSALVENSSIMKGAPEVKIVIQGHADERGTTDYNLALGQRRGDAVYRYMKSQGIAGSRMRVVSYGEEQALDSSHTESAWSRNRRCEFQVSEGDPRKVKGTTR